MKKLSVVLLILLAAMFLFAGCSSDEATDTVAVNGEDEQSEQYEQSDQNGQSEEKKDKPSYKETMLPFEELVPAERIVLLQNTLNFSREGFYNADNRPKTEEIEYNGETVSAYSINYALDFLTNGCKDELTVHNNDGSTETIAAEDFAGLYVIIDFTEGIPPILYNPQTGTEITDFFFAVTADGEAIYSIVSDSIHKTAEIIANVGWDAGATYRYMATDRFYIPVDPKENASGEIRGALSGAINGSFPDLTIASGKINDVIYIEAIK
ncbi:MAG: hypothetical protein GX996_01315 [Firmicutes bacterium]|nr:hypothetical protein [Bacillota bacterium]